MPRIVAMTPIAARIASRVSFDMYCRRAFIWLLLVLKFFSWRQFEARDLSIFLLELKNLVHRLCFVRLL